MSIPGPAPTLPLVEISMKQQKQVPNGGDKGQKYATALGEQRLFPISVASISVVASISRIAERTLCSVEALSGLVLVSLESPGSQRSRLHPHTSLPPPLWSVSLPLSTWNTCLRQTKLQPLRRRVLQVHH